MSKLAFDANAINYDNEFTFSAIGVLQRQRVYKHLLPLLNPNTKLFEINCGTGYDAITLSKHVAQIVATDISPAMILEAEKKRKKYGVSNVSFFCSDISSLPLHLNLGYDIVLSNFAGLNCCNTAQIEVFAKCIQLFLNSNAKLVLVMLSKKCWWENLWFALHNDKKWNRRNTDNAVVANVENHAVQTHYYSPKQLQRFFEEHFTVVSTKPIGLFIPPSYLNKFFINKKWILNAFGLLDKVFGNFSFLSNYADHYLMVLEKRTHIK
jgi:ubiquinone/menaquinone biosynthesis C-methylase UbiE